jgi:hypothetical protein
VRISVHGGKTFDSRLLDGMRYNALTPGLGSLEGTGRGYYVNPLAAQEIVIDVGPMGSNLTIGPKVNPWAITHMTEIKGGWGRIVWMPSWDSETSSHRVRNFKQPAFVSVARCASGGLFWANFPKPCENGELLPKVKEAIRIIATAKTRDSNGDLTLATGHNSPEEDLMMIREAVRVGVKHVIITHPLLDVVDMTDAQIKEAVGLGPEIYAEFTSQFGKPQRLTGDAQTVRGRYPCRRCRTCLRFERHRADRLDVPA